MTPLCRYRLINALCLGLLTVLGLSSKAYTGWGQQWINGYSGDLLYEIFWIWLLGFCWPRQSARRLAVLVFLITSGIEFSQLIPFPAAWQANLLWRLLLGSHFVGWDFLHYAAGSALGGWSLWRWQLSSGQIKLCSKLN